MKARILITFVALLVALHLAECGVRFNSESIPPSGWISSRQGISVPPSGRYPSSKYYSEYNQKAQQEAGPKSAESKGGLGISAWGIIGVVVGIIILSTVSYYVFILYPYLCKKARNYDMIELTDVAMCNMNDNTHNMSLYPSNSITIIH